MSLNERDNSATRFWENFTDTVAHYDMSAADEYRKIGFPDTAEKLDQLMVIRNNMLIKKPGYFIWDNFHLLKEPSVLHFIEKMANTIPVNSVMVFIGRDMSAINIDVLRVKGLISEINETDLQFTKNELSKYLSQEGLSSDSHTMHEIYEDTGGWAFAVNLVARSLKKSPNYFVYIKKTLKQNLFKLMELDSWDNVPARLQRFILRLSLVDYLSAEIVDILAEGDDELLSGLRNQNDYIRFDSSVGKYLIHHLFLDFLRTKQNILTNEEKRGTYKAAADWCKLNNFKMDAFGYYEKVGDYESIVSIFKELREHTTYDHALYVKGILDRAPVQTVDNVYYFASVHLYILFYLGRWQEFQTVAENYEQRFLKLQEDDVRRNCTLGGIYFHWGNMRQLMSTYDDRYGRVEMLAMEACVHYQMKNRELAFNSLREAYETAAPNNIITPFIELGKDMRTLTTTILREQADGAVQGTVISKSWLETIRQKASSFAKNQSTLISEYNRNNGNNKILSAREHDVLTDLYNGLSQSEIASKRNLALSTVKMVTHNIYGKLYIHKISDLIRITAEQGLL